MVMSPAQFYGNIGDRFGATAGRPNPHRGQDFPWGGGTEIPAFRNLLYLATYEHSGLGHVALAQGSDGTLVGFCHLLRASEWKRGQVILPGEVVGLVGNTGSLSQGNHLHLTASLSSWSPWAGPWIDPLAYVLKSLGGAAVGGGGTPTTSTPPTVGDDDMPLTEDDIYRIWTFMIGTADGRVRGKAADWLVNMSNEVGQQGGQLDAILPAMARVDAAVARIEKVLPGLAGDGFTPEQIKLIADRLLPALKIPTADENGAAARKAIVR